MKRILLICSAGMSTSLLVTKMQAAAKDMGVEADIFALSIAEYINVIDTVDVVLLGPQVRFQKASVEKVVKGRIKVDVINMKDYGTMNGKAVLEAAFKLMEN